MNDYIGIVIKLNATSEYQLKEHHSIARKFGLVLHPKPDSLQWIRQLLEEDNFLPAIFDDEGLEISVHEKWIAYQQTYFSTIAHLEKRESISIPVESVHEKLTAWKEQYSQKLEFENTDTAQSPPIKSEIFSTNKKATYEYFVIPKSETYQTPFKRFPNPIQYLRNAKNAPIVEEIRKELSHLSEEGYLKQWEVFLNYLDMEYETFYEDLPQYQTVEHAVSAVANSFERQLFPLLDAFFQKLDEEGTFSEVSRAVSLINQYISEELGFYTYRKIPVVGEKPPNEVYGYFETTPVYFPEYAGKVAQIDRLPYLIEFPRGKSIATRALAGRWQIYSKVNP
ncbi:MAG: hypothetical protein V3G42_08565 [Oscillospiraceae bacterium]